MHYGIENQVQEANIEILQILTPETADYSYRLTQIQCNYYYLLNA